MPCGCFCGFGDDGLVCFCVLCACGLGVVCQYAVVCVSCVCWCLGGGSRCSLFCPISSSLSMLLRPALSMSDRISLSPPRCADAVLAAPLTSLVLSDRCLTALVHSLHVQPSLSYRVIWRTEMLHCWYLPHPLITDIVACCPRATLDSDPLNALFTDRAALPL